MPSLSHSLHCIQINLRHSSTASAAFAQTILDENIDIALVQEPYAKVEFSGVSIQNIPPGYICLQNLSTTEHAYGAIIIAKAALNLRLSSLPTSNYFVIAELSTSHLSTPSIFFVSGYLRNRPPLHHPQTHFQNIITTLGPNIRSSVICLDANARSQLWGSERTDQNGTRIESLLYEQRLLLANKALEDLTFIPAGTSFIDITLYGDNISLSSWHYPDFPSLSDHPFIKFSVSLPSLPSRPLQERPTPLVKDIDVQNFLQRLKYEIARASVLTIYCFCWTRSGQVRRHLRKGH